MPGQETIIGSYRLLTPLGQGGGGIVYAAVEKDSGREVALKTVEAPSRGMLAGIRREIHALARLEHPLIVKIVDHGVHEGIPWYAMDKLSGVNLVDHFALVSPDFTKLQRDRGRRAPRSGTPPGNGKNQPEVWWTETLTLPARNGNQCGGPWYRGPTPSEAPARLPRTATQGQEIAAGHEEKGWESVTAPLGSSPLSTGGKPPMVCAGEAPENREIGSPNPSSRRRAAGGAIELALTLVARICDALDYLHGQGLVHRDLKPGNILVQPDGRPVLVDFGLAFPTGNAPGRESFEASGTLAGTAWYMAPEQIRGELVDARADLYAVGCILYELLTGSPPFLGSPERQVLECHLGQALTPASRVVSGIDFDLDRLLAHLLAKSPEERIGYARIVAERLVRLGAERPSQRRPAARPLLYRPRLAGRETALKELTASLEATREGSREIMFIVGESGSGKTRLAMEAATTARRWRMQVLAGECRSSTGTTSSSDSGGHPLLAGLRKPLEAVADRCRELGGASAQEVLGEHGRLLGMFQPSLFQNPGAKEWPPVPPFAPDRFRAVLYEALLETLSSLAAIRPLLLVIDDLQWADELTLGFLEAALFADTLNPAPWMILGTYRLEEAPEALRKLSETGRASKIELGKLFQAAVGRMVADMLAFPDVPQEFIQWLSQRSAGNPFFIAEYLRAGIAEGVLHLDQAGRWRLPPPSETEPTAGFETLDLPATLRNLFQRRLTGLDTRVEEILGAAAVLGEAPSLELLSSLVALDSETILDGILDLLRRQILKESEPGHLRFLHDGLRRVAYDNLRPDKAKQLHRLAAEALESRAPEPEPLALSELGSHWAAVGNRSKAQDYYLMAARAATSRYAHTEAERLYRNVIGLSPTPTPRSIQARNELAREVLHLQGRDLEGLDEEILALNEAQQIGDSPGEARSLQGLSTIQRALGRLQEAQDSCHRALDLFRELGDRKMEGTTWTVLGAAQLEGGALAKARRSFETAIQIHRETLNPSLEGISLSNLGVVQATRGDFLRAKELQLQALALHRKLQNRRSEGITLANLGSIEFHGRQIHRARELFGQALELLRLVGDPRYETETLTELTALYTELEDLPQALRLVHETQDLLVSIRDRGVEARALLQAAIVHRRLTGDLHRAGSLIASAMPLFDSLGTPMGRAACLMEMVHLKLARGGGRTSYLEVIDRLLAENDLLPACPLLRQRRRLEEAVRETLGNSGKSPANRWKKSNQAQKPGGPGRSRHPEEAS